MKLRYFRHPYLSVGRTLEIRHRFEKFLKDHGYTVAPVTVDFQDWKFNLLYFNAKKRNDKAEMARIVKAYLGYIPMILDYLIIFQKLSWIFH